jgi:hypothetical protein
VLRQGLVSALLHAIVEYLVAVLLIASPFLFGFESDAATALAIVAGVALLALTASSDLPASLAKMVPPGIHVAVDLVLAALFVAAPFLFGFVDETAPTALFIVLGVFHLLLTIGTRFVPQPRG